MPDPSARITQADSLARLLAEHHHAWHRIYLIPDEETAWANRLLTQLVLMLGDSEPVYVTTKVDEEGEALTFVIYLFTERSILIAEGSDRGENPHTATKVRVISRSAISGVSVTGGHGPYVAPETWPGRIEVTVTVDDEELVLPLQPIRTAGLADLIPTLLIDVTS